MKTGANSSLYSRTAVKNKADDFVLSDTLRRCEASTVSKVTVTGLSSEEQEALFVF